MLRSIALSVLFASAPAFAAEIVTDPTGYLTALDQLGPGDVLRLQPGDYTDCLLLFGMHGEEGAPITIEGPAPFGGGAVIRGGGCIAADGRYSAAVFIEDSSHLVIRNLEIDLEGAEVNGLRAGFGTTPVHDVIIESLHIHDNDVTNQYSGISTFCTTWRWTIRSNRIERVGLGMYLGDSDGSDPFIAGLIERNLVLNPRGYGIQIKHQVPRLAVAGMPEEDSVTILRDNVLIKAENAALGAESRPNLLIGDVPPSGIGASDRYEIYANFFYQNQTDLEPLLQGEGNLSIHDNVFVNAYQGNGILIQPHNGAVREIGIFHNTIVTEGIGISVAGGAATNDQRVLANAVYANGVPAILADDQAENAVGTLAEAAAVFVDPTPTLGQLDLYPRDDTVLKGDAVDLSAYAGWTDVEVDFNGDARDGTWRGAYAGSGRNPGWMLAAENRPLPAAPGTDAGVLDGGMEPDGSDPLDAGNFDAAEVPDAGEMSPKDAGASSPAEEEGCTCAGTPPEGGLSMLLLSGLVLLRRRRLLHQSGPSSSASR